MSEKVGPVTETLLDQARTGDGQALGRLLESYRAYLTLLAQVQIGRRLRGKVDAADVVQDAFLGAMRDFGQFRGSTEGEFRGWLRQILASLLANLVRHYVGTQRRDVRLERQLAVELEQSSQMLDRGLVANQSSPSQQAMRHEQSMQLAEALGRLPDRLVVFAIEAEDLDLCAPLSPAVAAAAEEVVARILAELRETADA